MKLKLPAFASLILMVAVIGQPAVAQQVSQSSSVQEIRALLESIHPYLPTHEIKSEIDLFGATSMDSMAHGWAAGFQRFHPQSRIAVSAEGSETVFDRIAKNPSSIAMVSRPVSEEDLQKLKESGMKQPVAVMVARAALGVYVNRENPIDAVDYQTLISLACPSDTEKAVTWGAAGLGGKFESEPVVIVGRNRESGTRTFLRNYVFRGLPVRETDKQVNTNYEVVNEIAKNPFAVGISSLRCGNHEAKLLHLKSNGTVIPSDEHSILIGSYPLVRPLCLIMDMGQKGETATANREFVLYTLSQAGQTDAILAGYFPFDPPTISGQVETIAFKKESSGPSESGDPSIKSTSRENKGTTSR